MPVLHCAAAGCEEAKTGMSVIELYLHCVEDCSITSSGD